MCGWDPREIKNSAPEQRLCQSKELFLKQTDLKLQISAITNSSISIKLFRALEIHQWASIHFLHVGDPGGSSVSHDPSSNTRTTHKQQALSSYDPQTKHGKINYIL